MAEKVNSQSDFLAEVVNAILRYRNLALATLTLTFGVSILFFVMQKPIYEASASISLGNIGLAAGRSTLLPPPEQVIASLQERYGDRYHRTEPGKAYLLSAGLSRKESSVIYFVARGPSPAEAVNFLSSIVNSELQDLKARVNNEIAAREHIIISRRESLALLKKQLSLLQDKEADGKEALSRYIVATEKANTHQQINFLEYEIFSLEADTRLLVADQLRILLSPTIENNGSPIQPQLLRYVILGLVLGIMFAFLLPWLKVRLQSNVHSYQT